MSTGNKVGGTGKVCSMSGATEEEVKQSGFDWDEKPLVDTRSHLQFEKDLFPPVGVRVDEGSR